MPDLADLAARFDRFGRIETPHTSPLYAQLALIVAADPDLLALAAECPPSQPAPNLLLGAVHYLLLQGEDGGGLAAYYPSRRTSRGARPVDAGLAEAFRRFCRKHRAAIVGLVHTRLVQTNEVGRCAALLPAFCLAAEGLPAGLWLVEIGASAGLNLCWDRYGYRYEDEAGRLAGALGDEFSPVQIETQLRGPARPPFPAALPQVAGRVGIDLHPIDVTDVLAVAWLRALIWPEHAGRVERLLGAARLAAEDPPPLLEGDALSLLPSVLGGAPEHARLVVFHSFTLHQFTGEGRHRFRAILAEASHRRTVVEVGIEMVADQSHARITLGEYAGGRAEVRELGLCDGHGRWLEWTG